jgi:uncharacterized protein with HEPN domain
MKKKRDIEDYLKDIVENIDKIVKFTSGISYEDFVNNDEKVYALIRAIEIIGEATKNVPQSIRKKYPEIPWKDMAGMRDKVIHEYFGVDAKIVWITATKEIPPLKDKILKVINEEIIEDPLNSS